MKQPRPVEAPLSEYRRKRSPDRTPEPFDAPAPGVRPGLFVVHKHAARRLHWDLRLELDGVLRSWAVPKGPSLDPAEKRLAAEVEDHPLDYADFEGVIPQGSYGAGPSIVWDRGLWVPIEDPREGHRKGKIWFELRGYKLKGQWELIRLKNPKDWLLFKKRDAYARAGESGFPEESILSGLTVEELGAGETKVHSVSAEAAAHGAERREVAPRSVALMLAETRDDAFSEKGWLFEPKIDGYRALAGRAGGKAFLLYRGGGDALDMYPELATALAALPSETVILDGEIAILDAAGKPSFQSLQRRGLLQRRPDRLKASVESPATLFVFDLLALGDLDLRPVPLTKRKELLERLLPRAGPLRVVPAVEERGEALFAEAARLGFEGMVAKKADSPYRGGRSRSWLKVRVETSEDFAVVGFTEPKDTRVGMGALHLAWWDAGRLVYAGRVGSGFTVKELARTREELEEDLVPSPPCEGSVPKSRENRWVTPRLVCEVRYKEWTEDHLLRQPVFLRFRTDKRPEECVRPGAAPEPADLPPTEMTPPVARADPEDADKRRVVIARPEKVFWPKDGYTKGDLAAYYEAISPWLLPYLEDRPVVLTRYPDGIDKQSFYQKDAPGWVPSWLRRVRVYSDSSEKEIDYFVVDDPPSLMYLVNLGTIPLHVWSSRVQTLQRPDWCILDLDPKTAPFSDVVTIAKRLHALCEEVGLPSFVKTSGSTGLHVLVPLGGTASYEDSRNLAMLLARVVLTDLSGIATVVRNPSSREGKVYIDTLQNRHGQLLVAPFSARPLPGAPVSMPLEWREVNARLDLSHHTIRTAPRRMARLKKDPFRGVLGRAPDFGKVLGRVAALGGAKGAAPAGTGCRSPS